MLAEELISLRCLKEQLSLRLTIIRSIITSRWRQLFFIWFAILFTLSHKFIVPSCLLELQAIFQEPSFRSIESQFNELLRPRALTVGLALGCMV